MTKDERERFLSTVRHRSDPWMLAVSEYLQSADHDYSDADTTLFLRELERDVATLCDRGHRLVLTGRPARVVEALERMLLELREQRGPASRRQLGDHLAGALQELAESLRSVRAG